MALRNTQNSTNAAFSSAHARTDRTANDAANRTGDAGPGPGAGTGTLVKPLSIRRERERNQDGGGQQRSNLHGISPCFGQAT